MRYIWASTCAFEFELEKTTTFGTVSQMILDANLKWGMKYGKCVILKPGHNPTGIHFNDTETLNELGGEVAILTYVLCK